MTLTNERKRLSILIDDIEYEEISNEERQAITRYKKQAVEYVKMRIANPGKSIDINKYITEKKPTLKQEKYLFCRYCPAGKGIFQRESNESSKFSPRFSAVASRLRILQ